MIPDDFRNIMNCAVTSGHLFLKSYLHFFFRGIWDHIKKLFYRQILQLGPIS
jgi:hypothetical protein